MFLFTHLHIAYGCFCMQQQSLKLIYCLALSRKVCWPLYSWQNWGPERMLTLRTGPSCPTAFSSLLPSFPWTLCTCRIIRWLLSQGLSSYHCKWGQIETSPGLTLGTQLCLGSSYRGLRYTGVRPWLCLGPVLTVTWVCCSLLLPLGCLPSPCLRGWLTSSLKSSPKPTPYVFLTPGVLFLCFECLQQLSVLFAPLTHIF